MIYPSELWVSFTNNWDCQKWQCPILALTELYYENPTFGIFRITNITTNWIVENVSLSKYWSLWANFPFLVCQDCDKAYCCPFCVFFSSCTYFLVYCVLNLPVTNVMTQKLGLSIIFLSLLLNWYHNFTLSSENSLNAIDGISISQLNSRFF